MKESGRTRGYSFRLFGLRFGAERSPIIHGGSVYMVRYIAYFFGCTLRLHQFLRGDRDRMLHNHPFAFVTFPLASYDEVFWDAVRRCERRRTVKAFRFHFRGLAFRHRVTRPSKTPTWTLVATGPYKQQWGFFPNPDTFEPYNTHEGAQP